MKINNRDLITIGINGILIYLILYLIGSTILIAGHFGRQMDRKFVKLVNEKLALITKKRIKLIEFKDAILQKDLVLSVIFVILFFGVIVYLLFLLNGDKVKAIYSELKPNLIANLILIIVFNAPVIIYIAFFASKKIMFDFSGKQLS